VQGVRQRKVTLFGIESQAELAEVQRSLEPRPPHQGALDASDAGPGRGLALGLRGSLLAGPAPSACTAVSRSSGRPSNSFTMVRRMARFSSSTPTGSALGLGMAEL